MKALTNNWQVSEAERKMVSIQAELNAAVRLEEKKTADVTTTVRQSIATRDEEASAKMSEDIRLGRAHFESADEATRKELVRLYVASQAGKLILRRLKVDASTLSDANILHHAELSVYFGQFVSGRARMYRGANNRAQVT